ncbi:integral peroxisomal membrane peroxin-domain-containing protein [Lineolata rhizophorae]|uniref:Integral peroxisomal membrane peroxin-domain-containing protein n=1 Tax=Lineolata rhizophorae TaxID=578093 RepID=A0A6A6PE92_9PEZI|nr:integral peroxisomal membrane peroxin-domain-containing protein [Lineolata rhizophorae]
MDYHDYHAPDGSFGEPIVNRDDPVPVVSVTAPVEERDDGDGADTTAQPSEAPSRREARKNILSPSALKEKLENLSGGGDKSRETPSSIQDRLFTMLLQQVIPPDERDDDGKEQGRPTDRRSREYVERPAFSLPAMSYNFRRFNARIGVAFVFQNRLIRLFSWSDPSHTLSFLAVYTFVCLDPYLLAVVPIASTLFFVMVPAFLTRHPPPPIDEHTASSDVYAYPMAGPPLAPPRHIKPAPELSKDFFRNMRDLQNSMEDFSRLHDAAIALLAPPTNFSDEAFSSMLFLLLTFAGSALFISAHLLPWRAIFLVAGWAAAAVGHPTVRDALLARRAGAALAAREHAADARFRAFASADIALSDAPERREVEVFELQFRPLHAGADAEFEPFIFAPHPYTPLSPARIAGDRPKGTRFFEDVRPPRGWRWCDKKWTLDLLSREWVEERCVTGVEVEVEGERWVSDILYEDEEEGGEGDGEDVMGLRSPKKAREKPKLVRTWEEGNNMGRKGEWRRRRWIRLVERMAVEDRGDG